MAKNIDYYFIAENRPEDEDVMTEEEMQNFYDNRALYAVLSEESAENAYLDHSTRLLIRDGFKIYHVVADEDFYEDVIESMSEEEFSNFVDDGFKDDRVESVELYRENTNRADIPQEILDL